MQKEDAEIGAFMRKITRARKLGHEVDIVFTVLRRREKKDYEVLLGRHKRVGNTNVAALPQANFPRDAELEMSWKSLHDVFYSCIKVVHSPDLVTVGPPLFIQGHTSYNMREKLLLYVGVGMPDGAVFVSVEGENAFTDTFWCSTDTETIRLMFSECRCDQKATSNLAAVMMAESQFALDHY